MTPTAHRKPNLYLLALALLVAALNFLGSGCEKVVQGENLEERADGLLYEKGSKEPFTGIWTKYHEVLEGQRKAFYIHYEKGLPQGSFETFYPHGITETSGEYIVAPHKGSLKHGEFLAWRENGTRISKKLYENGELNGPYFMYHDKWNKEEREASGIGNQPENDATIQYEANYKNGALDGPYHRLNKDGSLLESGSYHEGKLDGEQIFYYPKIHLLAIRDHRDFLRPTRFPAIEEGYDEAASQARSIHESTPLSHNPEGRPISVVGFDPNGKFLTILWTTQQAEKASWSELSEPRRKYLRRWEKGKVLQTTWFDPDGERVIFEGSETSAISQP